MTYLIIWLGDQVWNIYFNAAPYEDEDWKQSDIGDIKELLEGSGLSLGLD